MQGTIAIHPDALVDCLMMFKSMGVRVVRSTEGSSFVRLVIEGECVPKAPEGQLLSVHLDHVMTAEKSTMSLVFKHEFTAVEFPE